MIRLDGVDLRELTLDGLRGRIALVAQDTYLFNDTLEANVRLARPDATAGAGCAGAVPRGAGRISSRDCRRGWRRASASGACSYPAASASGSPSPGPS